MNTEIIKSIPSLIFRISLLLAMLVLRAVATAAVGACIFRSQISYRGEGRIQIDSLSELNRVRVCVRIRLAF